MANRTILIVEDDATTRQLLARLFGRHGFIVKEATNAADAMGLIRGADIILTDVNMPGLDGGSFAQMVKSSFNVPVVVLTGERGKVVDDLKTIVDAVILKPSPPSDIFATVARVAKAIHSVVITFF